MNDKKYPITEKGLRELLKSIAKTAINEVDPIIEDSIFAFKLSKKPVDTLDRDMVEKIFKPAFTEISNAPRSWNDNFMKALYVLLLGIKDNILSLIPKQQLWNEKSIGEIITKYDDGIHQDMGVIIPYKDMSKFVTELSQLAQPDKSMDRVKEIMVEFDADVLEEGVVLLEGREAINEFLHTICKEDKDE